MSESIPYTVEFGEVTGDPFTGFAFKDVRVRVKHSARESLRIREVDLQVSWSALLFRHEIRFERIVINLDPGKAIIRGHIFLKPSISGQCDIEDEHFPLDTLLRFTQQHAPAIRLVHTGHWAIHKDSSTVTVDMNGQLNEAPIWLHGNYGLGSVIHESLNWIGFPLRTFLSDRDVGGQTASLRLMVFGNVRRLNGSIQLKSVWADAECRLVDGLGFYRAIVGPSHFKSILQGRINLATLSITGSGVIQEGVWQQAHLAKMDFTFSADAHHQMVRLHANDVSWQSGTPRPTDVAEAEISMTGSNPRWRSVANIIFKDRSRVQVGGIVLLGDRFGRFTWNKLDIALGSAGTWTAQGAGWATWAPTGRMTLQHLYLRNGEQTIQVPSAILSKSGYHFEAIANQVETGPWATFFVPDVSLTGQFQSSLQVNGSPTDIHIDGFLNGHFPTLTDSAVGLSIRDIDVRLKCKNQTFDILTFTGKTKKGTIAIAGHSTLPQLDYTIHAHDWDIQPYPGSRASGNLDLTLAGKLNDPVLAGHIALKEAIYVAPTKEKKRNAQKPVTESPPTAPDSILASRLDIRVDWPRNVWYRDGASSVETRGDLRLQKATKASRLQANGTITSLRGSYTYFGRSFNIESGQLLFSDSDELNPSINIEASYATGATTVYLDITGTAKAPVLKMHSNPPLSDQDIVSVIVFGQPLNELRGRTGGVAGNQEMMKAVGGVLGGYVTKGLNQTGIPLLNVDILNIQPADQGGSQLTVGRYLTRRLFISYGQTVEGSAEKTITADYFMTDKWTLQGASNSSTGNYLDFLFRYPLNKKGSSVNTPPLPSSPFRNQLDQPTFQSQFRTPMQ